MEIVTIPLRGTVAHKDSSGGEGVTKSGDVQIMSAGTGVTHSEYNASSTEPLELLQIWVMPERQGLLPRYEQKTFDVSERQNKWQLLVSPTAEMGSLQVFQNAWFSIAHLVPGADLRYDFHGSAMGAYVFIVSGSVKIADDILTARDAMGITEASNVSIEAQGAAEVLIIEVPV
jgi:redox-sensitive bicupin YhaK (pirin superfamily)